MYRRARAWLAPLAKQSAAVLGFAALGLVILTSGLLMLAWMVQESWDDSERRDAAARCPERPGLDAEVRLDSGVDWCVYRDAMGTEVDGRVAAGPVVRRSMWSD